MSTTEQEQAPTPQEANVATSDVTVESNPNDATVATAPNSETVPPAPNGEEEKKTLGGVAARADAAPNSLDALVAPKTPNRIKKLGIKMGIIAVSTLAAAITAIVAVASASNSNEAPTPTPVASGPKTPGNPEPSVTSTTVETSPTTSPSPSETTASPEPSKDNGELDATRMAELEGMSPEKFAKQPLADQIAYGAARDKAVDEGYLPLSSFFGSEKTAMTSAGKVLAYFSHNASPLTSKSGKDAIMLGSEYALTLAQSAAVDESKDGSAPIDHDKAQKLASYVAVPGSPAYQQLVNDLSVMKTTGTIPGLAYNRAVSMENGGAYTVPSTEATFKESKIIIEKRDGGTYEVHYVEAKGGGVTRWLQVINTRLGD